MIHTPAKRAVKGQADQTLECKHTQGRTRPIFYQLRRQRGRQLDPEIIDIFQRSNRPLEAGRAVARALRKRIFASELPVIYAECGRQRASSWMPGSRARFPLAARLMVGARAGSLAARRDCVKLGAARPGPARPGPGSHRRRHPTDARSARPLGPAAGSSRRGGRPAGPGALRPRP